ncbi:MAG: ATP-binding protein [Bacilli bacterium]|nr:ATP-binding protein [Bacilli bacterium]
MSIFTEENIINLLYSYNPWWKTGIVLRDFDKPMKRIPYYEANLSFDNKLRRMVLLSGARRTGKTTIMYQTISRLIKKGIPVKNIVFISFDHPLLKMCSIDAVLKIYNENISLDKDIYCFFDEIQYSENWNEWLKVLYDTNTNIKVMATGSASPILQDKVKESGLGRWIKIQVPTLSFFEYCELINLEKVILPENIKPTQLYLLSKQEQIDIMQKLSFLQPHFIRYLQIGGFPELALSNDDLYSQRILREDIVDKAIKRDLPSIYAIRNIGDIEKIFLYLCYNSSNIINLQTICKELGINRNTLEKYIGYLESANLIYISKMINISSKQILKSQNKIYISDAAIRNAVLMKDDITDDPAELGIVTETAVYKHVKSFSYDKIAEVGYYRGGEKNKEIDIVVKYHSSQKPIMIEVKYREDSQITEKDLIVECADSKIPNLVITKKIEDYGLYNEYKEGRSIYKISAPVFLYLLGYVESCKSIKQKV